MNEATRLRLLYFLVFCCTAAWLPVMADFLRHQGLTDTQLPLVMAVTPLLMLLFQPYYGVLADRYGYRKSLLLSTFFASVSYLGYLVNGGFAWLMIVTILMSLFYNGIQPLLDSLSLQLSKEQPKFSYGKLRIAGAAGWSFTGIITGHLIDAIDTNVICIIAAISLFLSFIIAIGIRSSASTTYEKLSWSQLPVLLGNRSLIVLLTAVFLVSAGTSAIWYFYSTYMKENGASASLVGYGLSFQGLCELPLFYFSAVIIKRLGMRNTLLLTMVASVIRLFLYSVTTNPYAALPIEVLHGFSWSLFWVVCVEYVNGLVKVEWRATGQSLLYAAYFGAGTIAGNFWTSYLSATDMKISEVFMLNAGIIIIVTIATSLFLRKNRLAV